MKKNNNFRAFTIIELMVSIFITITIIASFYKLYESSIKTERSAAIRSGVNLMGEQILDNISESFRLIGLNSSKSDFGDATTGPIRLISTTAYPIKFTYLSPYGSPVTKIVQASENYPGCVLKLFNSASFYTGINELFLHNQNGFFKAKVSCSGYSEEGVTCTVSEFLTPAGQEGDQCDTLFPAGSIVTGEDYLYELSYTASGSNNSLQLLRKDYKGEGAGEPMINFDHSGDKDDFYSMPNFVLEFLCEYKCGTDMCRKWIGSGLSEDMTDHIKHIVAVRFGFVLLSKKERVSKGGEASKDASGLPKYCIFKLGNTANNSNTENYCYQLKKLNYTASVFSRVVYLSNYRLLKDQVGE